MKISGSQRKTFTGAVRTPGLVTIATPVTETSSDELAAPNGRIVGNGVGGVWASSGAVSASHTIVEIGDEKRFDVGAEAASRS